MINAIIYFLILLSCDNSYSPERIQLTETIIKNNGFIKDLRSFARDENYSERREILIKKNLYILKYYN